MSIGEQKIITRDTLSPTTDITYVKDNDTHPGIARYGIFYLGERVGRTTLMERTEDREIGFDIYISRNGQNLGIKALQALAASLDEEGYSLVTAGIRAGDARGYWEHQEAGGRVEAVNPTRPQTTNYRVLPLDQAAVSGTQIHPKIES